MRNLKFQQVTEDVLGATRAAWTAQLQDLGPEVPSSHYHRILGWVEESLRNGRDPNAYFYALAHAEGAPAAQALLEITHARPGGSAWLKVLQVHVEPRLDLSAEGSPTELAAVVGRSLVEALDLTFEAHPSDQLKIFGRSPLTVNFLEGVSGCLGEKGVKVYVEGSWLVIDKASV